MAFLDPSTINGRMDTYTKIDRHQPCGGRSTVHGMSSLGSNAMNGRGGLLVLNLTMLNPADR